LFTDLREAIEVSETAVEALIRAAFAAVMAKDLDACLAGFAEDGVLIDPHYPIRRMEGKAAIADGLRWSFGGMEVLGFEIERYFEAADGRSAAVEVATHHVLKGGRSLNFPQVFVFQVRDGLITRLQAYEPYGPGGIVGLFLGVQRLLHRRRQGGTT
jgi:ketosteroid isomerase-like protein